MITKGIVIKLLTNNKLKVRLPIFENTGFNDKVEIEGTVCYSPGNINSYKVGDIVYVGFEDNKSNSPVVLGKLYLGKTKEAAGFNYIDALEVMNNAKLPTNTTIGGVPFNNVLENFKLIKELINIRDIFVNSIQFKTNNEDAGKLFFDDEEGVLNLTISPNVTMAVGVDSVLKVYNDTDEILTDGQVVYVTNTITDITPVALASGNDYTQSERVIGVVTEPIPVGGYGFVSCRGFVGGLVIDPAEYNIEDVIYLSPDVPGGITRIRPLPPNFITKIGHVTKLSSDGSTADGQIYVNIVSVPVAVDINYDNEYITDVEHRLTSKSTQGAIDELQLNKADISMLSSNITLYRTLVDSDVVGYKKLVTSTADSDYPAEATAVSSGAITTTDQYIAGAISPANLFVGNPGQINIFSIGRVRKASGNNNQNAEFFFRIYKRDSEDIETLLATSAVTGVVSSTEWLTFNATALLNNGNFTSTDRIVVKSYANVVGIAGGTFEYEFGGINPFRLLIPVPVSVIPTSVASAIFTDTTNFDKILSHLDINVQKALETLDNHSHTDATTSESGFMPATDKTKLDAATSNNTASTIVTRDSNKDFSANIITTNSIKIGNGEVEMVYDSESDSVKFIWN